MAIVRRGKNKFLVRIYSHRDPITGKRIDINETFHGDLEEAKKREQVLKNKVKNGTASKSSNITVNQLIDSYLDVCRYGVARFNANSLLHKVWFTRGVRRVVSFDNGPVSIDDEIISYIQRQTDEHELIRPCEGIRQGDTVMIQDGPLKSLVGIFEKEVKRTDRVMIMLSAVSYQGSVTIEKERRKKVS